MKTYLIITLGTRDVQLRKDKIDAATDWEVVKNINPKTGRDAISVKRAEIRLPVFANDDFADYFTFLPRSGGKIIDDNLSAFEPILELPLIMPVVDSLAEQTKTIDCVMLIYTDQQTELDAGLIKNNHYNNDTLFFKDIVTALLKKHPLFRNSVFDEYGIFEKVANIDHQYQHFAEAKKGLLLGEENEIKEIILLPQGGIDQINHAITLQLIQAFKHKVRLLQKPEANKPIELRFTHQFLNDLNKQKILKHLSDYDFGLIDKTLTSNSVIEAKSDYANKRLSMRHIELNSSFTSHEKCKDLYLAAKIASIKQKKPTEFLWRLFTINENLFKIEIETLVGDSKQYFIYGLGKKDNNTRWENALNQTDDGLVKYLKDKNIEINNPYRKAFKWAYIYLTERGKLPKNLVEKRVRVSNKLEFLAKTRNEAMHGLGAISIDEINSILTKENYSIQKLIADLDQIFEVEGFGIYDQIKAEIETLL